MDETWPREAETTGKRPRLELVDFARAAALVAMASYHFIWDLELFGYVDSGTAGNGWPKAYARLIASSFLFLVGVSLVLAHWPSFRRRGFARRLAMVAGAAALITAATLYFVPDTFIFFGILHSIALASVLGLLFVRLPPLVTLAAAVFFFALPQVYRSEFFDAPWLWWVGLSATIPRSNDYVPLFPWFAPVLLGIAAARLSEMTGLTARLSAWRPAPDGFLRRFGFIGRHSLAFYLIHQPVLITLVWLASQVLPPSQADAFVSECVASCSAGNGEDMCVGFCTCTSQRLADQGLLADVQTGRIGPTEPAVAEIARACTAASIGENRSMTD